MADVFDKHLRDGKRAVDIYREVLILMPSHEAARAALEGMMRQERHAVDAARVLEPVYESLGDWSSLVDALKAQVLDVADPSERLDLLNRIAEIYSVRLSDAHKAFDVYAEAFREVPNEESILSRLEMLASEQDRYQDLVRVLSSVASSSSDAVQARSCLMKAAEIEDMQRGDVDAAIALYSRVLEQNPGDHEALQALEILHRRASRWGDLLQVLEKRVELSNDLEEKTSFLMEMAQIQDEQLGQVDESIRCFQELLGLDPTSLKALSALDELFARKEDWPELAENIEKRIALEDDIDQQNSLMLRLAQLRLQHLDSVDSALDVYREILERDPQNQTALQALENLAQIKPKYQVQVSEILEPVYRSSGDVTKLIDVHEMQVQNSDSVGRSVELLHRIAQLKEEALGDYHGAFKDYARALAVDPSDPLTQENLERLASASGAWQELAQVYESQLAEAEEDSLRVALLNQLAEVQENYLQDFDGAIASYKQVFALDARQVEAATALQRLHQSVENYEALAQVTIKKAAALSSPEEQKEELLKAALVYEEMLHAPELAADVYSQVLEIDEFEVRALDRLVSVYLQLEKWTELLRVYNRKIDAILDPEEKKRLLVEVGAVYERELQQPEKAIDTYQRILEIDPEDRVAIARLDVLHQASANWTELLSVLERQVDLAEDPREALAHRFRIAELWDQKLDDAARALDGYREILQFEPEHAGVLEALERMIADGRSALVAAELLEPVYRVQPNPAKLAQVIEVQVAHCSDEFRSAELLQQLAELYEVQLGDARRAFDAYARAVDADPGSEQMLASVERMADQLGAWDELAKLYDAQIEKLGEEARVDLLVSIALRHAQIREIHAADAEGAITRYKIAISADPGQIEALAALDRLYASTGQWNELAEIIAKELQVVTDPNDMLALQMREAELYRDVLSSPDRALDRYREVLAVEPEFPEAVAALEEMLIRGVRVEPVGELLGPIYRDRQDWGRLIELNQHLLAMQSDVAERISLEHQLQKCFLNKSEMWSKLLTGISVR
ncbi:MAG: hypothetical protein IPJ88_11425 [Myxococcales bacterium]|nr:MAG: hypothetical protein IPJ88_11425 [Myxococcales bacterium]